MCGLAINIMSFAHLLKRVDFDAIEDHLALIHILKSKTEPATTGIKRLVEVLSMYSFNQYYMKGTDMILSDFLSRQRVDKSNLHEIIPISFDMKVILKKRYYNIENESRYLVQTCSQAKDSGIKLPEVHGVNKGINPDIKSERQAQKSQNLAYKSKAGQEKEGIRRERRVPTQVQGQVQIKNENQTREQTKNLQVPLTKQTTVKYIEQELENDITPRYISRPTVTEIKVPNYPDPLRKPPSRLPGLKTQDFRKINLDIHLEINKDFEENSPYREGIISEIYQRPDRSQLLEPPELVDLVNTNNIVQKYLPWEADIDKILKITQRRVLKGTHLPMTVKEIQVGYLHSPYFKDLYLYLTQNKLPSSKTNIQS